MENSLYCRFSTEQSLSQCHGLSLDDAQQCDCWHHHFSWLVYVQSVSFGLCQTKRGLCQCHQCRKPSSRSIWSFMLLPGRLLMTGTLYSTPLYSTPCWTVNYYPRIMEWSLHKFFNCVFTSYIYPLISVTFPFFVVCRLMMHSNVIVGINISRGSFVFSQSRVKVSASLTNVGSLAVGAFDLVNCSLYMFVVGVVPVLNVGQYISVVT